jgi:hypothetical protein
MSANVPEFAVNQELRDALVDAGADPDWLADTVGVDIKTVRRWLDEDRTPHPRHRAAVARALKQDERLLWPKTRPRVERGALDEIAGAFARRSDPGAPDWLALLRRSEHQVDLLGYSLMSVAETRGINQMLIDKVAGSVPVRIMLADPDTPHVLGADQALRPAGRLVRRINGARNRLEPLTAYGIQLRLHRVATSHTIVRVDEHLLATIHLYGTPGFQAPLLHLRRRGDYQLFDQLVTHYENIWATASPIGAAPGPAVTQPDAPNPTDDRDAFLDSLDDVWRPSA